MIVPAKRLENGYRQYTESQVETAQLVNSLRQADVSIVAIRTFLQASPEDKERLLEEWRNKAAVKLLSLQIANQYLCGIDSRTKRMHLVHWEAPTEMLWFPLDRTCADGQWMAAVQAVYRKVKEPKTVLERSGYVRFGETPAAEGDAGGVRLEVGFITAQRSRVPDGARLETMPQTLFVTLDCRWDMPFSCKPILSLIQRFGFQSAGEPLRKVAAEGGYTLMVPVMSNESSLRQGG